MKNNKRPSHSKSRPTGHQAPSSRKSGARSGGGSNSKSNFRSDSHASPSGSRRLEIPKSWRVIAGTHAIFECLRVRPKSIRLVYFDKNWSSSHDLRALFEELKPLAKSQSLEVHERSQQELEKICHSHQGCVIFASETPHFNPADQGWETQSLLLALDGVEDPHNLGAIMRTSWLMGVKGLMIPSDRAVGLTPTVHKVACGGVEHVPVAQTQNFSDVFKKLKESGFWIFGLSHKSEKTIYDLKVPEKVIWVLGAEDKGLRTTTEKNCDELVRLPQLSDSASYNVSVAAGMALAETRRQWTR